MISVKYTLRGYLTNWYEPYESGSVSLTKKYISDYPISIYDIDDDTMNIMKC